MVEQQTAGVREVFARLAEHGLHVWRRQQWSESHGSFCKSYFSREILPILTPLAIQELKPGPLLPNLQLNVAALLVRREASVAGGGSTTATPTSEVADGTRSDAATVVPATLAEHVVIVPVPASCRG